MAEMITAQMNEQAEDQAVGGSRAAHAALSDRLIVDCPASASAAVPTRASRFSLCSDSRRITLVGRGTHGRYGLIEMAGRCVANRGQPRRDPCQPAVQRDGGIANGALSSVVVVSLRAALNTARRRIRSVTR